MLIRYARLINSDYLFIRLDIRANIVVQSLKIQNYYILVRCVLGELGCTAASVFRAATAVGPMCQRLQWWQRGRATSNTGREVALAVAHGSSGTASGCCICMHGPCTYVRMQASKLPPADVQVQWRVDAAGRPLFFGLTTCRRDGATRPRSHAPVAGIES